MTRDPDVGFRATLGECLRRASRTFAGKDFIVLPDRRASFSEIESASRRLAKRLLAAGIGKGSRVALFYTYGPEFCTAWLAVVRIGAVAMPISTLNKPTELQTVLRVGDAQLLLAPPSLLGKDVTAMLEEGLPRLVDQTTPELFLAEVPYLRAVWFTGPHARRWATEVLFDAAPPPHVSDELLASIEEEVTPADWAQVTYTSGSAALPKGVIHTHGTIVGNTSPTATEWSMRAVGLDWPVDKIFCAFPFFWVGGTLILGQALQCGWTVCCLERFEPVAALDLIERERPERLMAWPSLVHSLTTDPSFAQRDLSSIEAFRAPPPARPPQPGLTRHRGMSETMGNWFGIDCKAIDPDSGIDVGDGAEGELLVRGWAVTQGYYKKTREEIFDPDGWLHTGDRVILADGRPWFVGRYSELIKSQGANVSPREVEVLLESYLEVQHAIVFGLPHPQFEEEVTAVVVPVPGAAIDPGELQARARKALSSYKVPTRIEIVASEAEIPWLATGKPDKLRLRDMLLATQ